MKRSTLYLSILAVALLAGWYILRTTEKGELSVPEHREFFRVDTARVDSIAFKYATWTHLGRFGGVWQVYYPAWSYPADPGMMARMFDATNEMVLENLIATKASKHDKFKIDSADGAILQFFERGRPHSQMVVGKRAPGVGHTYVRRMDSDSVYQARGDLLQVFRRAPSDWLSKTVFEFDSSEVSRLQWQEGNVETVVERHEDRIWRLSKTGMNTTEPVDTALLHLKIRMLCPLRTDAFQMDPSPVEPAFDDPWGRVILTTYDGRADTLLWNPIREEDMGRTYAFRPGRARPLFIFFKPSYDRLFSRYDDLVVKDTVAPES
jgi:hypothetical protein